MYKKSLNIEYEISLFTNLGKNEKKIEASI